jgi:hypothetical protein
MAVFESARKVNSRLTQHAADLWGPAARFA